MAQDGHRPVYPATALAFPASCSSRWLTRGVRRQQDILTNDEIISDSYDLKEIDGIVYEADCAMITEEAVNVGMSEDVPGLPRRCLLHASLDGPRVSPHPRCYLSSTIIRVRRCLH